MDQEKCRERRRRKLGYAKASRAPSEFVACLTLLDHDTTHPKARTSLTSALPGAANAASIAGHRRRRGQRPGVGEGGEMNPRKIKIRKKINW
jgi:hypothetical protein